MHLGYCGAPFHGWQIQPHDNSVQQTIEEALSTILRRPTPIVGAGRTDAGVNARNMVAHFDMEPGDVYCEDPQQLVGKLNALVGKDIAIYRIERVADDAHARFDAKWRTYRYYALEEKSPFFHQLVWKASRGLDYEAMNRAARLLLTTDDFTSFAKLHSDAKTNICRVTHAQWHQSEEPGVWYFEITADRFLRNMVRAVVGTLVEVGRGKLDVDGFAKVIRKADRCSAGTSMPAHALYLWNVEY